MNESLFASVYSRVHSYGMGKTKGNPLALAIAGALSKAMDERHPRPSQADLARVCGVKQPTISRTLKGLSVPETPNLAKLADYLRLDVDALAMGKYKPVGKAPAQASTTFAGNIKAEEALDPYQLINQGLKALVIVGEPKDEIIALITKHASHSAQIQKQLFANLNGKAKKEP